MQVGHSAEPLPSWVGNPMAVDEVVMDFPDLLINLSHTGYPWIKEWVDLVWKHPKQFMGSGKENRKVMWGTNGLGLKRGKQQIMQMDMKDEFKKNILRDNALRFMGLAK